MKPEISFILTVLLPDGSRINIFPGWLQILRFACQSIQEEFLNFRLCIILDFHVYLKFFLFYFWHETFPGIQFNPVTSNYENALLWDEAFCRRHKMPLCMADLQDACTILGKVMNFKCWNNKGMQNFFYREKKLEYFNHMKRWCYHYWRHNLLLWGLQSLYRWKHDRFFLWRRNDVLG